MKEKKDRIRKIIYRDGIILLAGILYAVFVRLTGLAVPRACLSLIKGNVQASFSYNPFLYIAGPCIIYLIVREDLNYIKKDTYRLGTADTVLIYILIVAALIFSVVRNL